MSATPTTPADRPVLDQLRQPTAEMIETRTVPPYTGAPASSVPGGPLPPVGVAAAEAKGLASGGHLNADYATVQNMYKAILFPRLAKDLGLSEYDTALADHAIPPMPDDRMDLAQYASLRAGVGLRYLYIRNNVYVERLAPEQIAAFLARANDPAFAADAGLAAIVDSTYPRVISLLDMPGDIMTAFDTSGDRFYNDAVVVNVAYFGTADELDENGRGTDLYRTRSQFVRVELLDRMKAELPTRTAGHVAVFVTWAHA